MNMHADFKPVSTGEPAIQIEQVNKQFGAVTAIENLSFHVNRGEIVSFLGRTGAGKSTALNLIMGNMSPTKGRVRVMGMDPNKDFRKLRRTISVGFQTDRLLPWRTALENVELGLQILHHPKGEIREKAQEWLKRVNLADAAGLYPHELSGGMRQRVSLARALAIDPEILLLDECFSQLDHVTSQTLRADVSAVIRQYNKTCLFITHRIDDAIEMADRILVLGAPAKLLLEVSPTPEDRTDREKFQVLHDKIADALGVDA
ncbi:ABC transporter ATP-binding protein [Thalassovita sp.]|uniref:ABC transporter ATP-binding protein n=1 Tax=Thalassovita sp. TaxID=1979401 RepID=UPI0029DE8247|nr:ABC transporter ATP-binding protein [Thalassovita sp.]